MIHLQFFGFWRVFSSFITVYSKLLGVAWLLMAWENLDVLLIFGLYAPDPDSLKNQSALWTFKLKSCSVT